MVQLIHEIALQPMLDKRMNIEDMTNSIFAENKFFLHTRVIAKMQVQRLIEKVISRQQAHQNKENNSNKFNQQKAAAPSIMIEKETKPQQPLWMDAVPNAASSYDQQQQYKDLESDPQTDNSVVINPSAMDDLDIQIKSNGDFQKE